MMLMPSFFYPMVDLPFENPRIQQLKVKSSQPMQKTGQVVLMKTFLSHFFVTPPPEVKEWNEGSNYNNNLGFICHFHIAQLTVMNIFKCLDK